MKKMVSLMLRPNRNKTKSIYYLRWTDNGKPKRQSLGHANAKRAAKQLRIKKIELGSFTPDQKTGRRKLISKLVVDYLMANRKLESSTRDLTLQTFDFMVNAVGDVRLCNFEYTHAEQFQAWCIETGRNGTTANIYTKAASPVFKWAIKQKFIVEDPFENLDLFKVPKKRIRIYEPEEVAAMLDLCSDDLWKARILAAKTAGLRRGEVMNLTDADVDYRNGVIYVQEKSETKHTWRWTVKDKDMREVPLIPELAVLLKRIRRTLPATQPYLLLGTKRYQDLMQLKAEGRLIDRVRKTPDHSFSPQAREILDDAGVHGKFHDLRRTCITEWLEMGLQPHEVQQLAGHSDIKTTMDYYVTTRKSLLEKARNASSKVLNVA